MLQYLPTKKGQIYILNLPAKKYEEIPWNKLCVYLIDHYFTPRKGKKKDLQKNNFTMINAYTGWFEIMEFDNKC